VIRYEQPSTPQAHAGGGGGACAGQMGQTLEQATDGVGAHTCSRFSFSLISFWCSVCLRSANSLVACTAPAPAPATHWSIGGRGCVGRGECEIGTARVCPD